MTVAVSPFPGTTPSRVYLGRLDPDDSNYLALIREGLVFARFGEGLAVQPRIFVKPNLTFPTYRPGVMTSPAAVEAALIALRERGCSVWLGDSDSGGYNRFSMDEVYAKTGIADFASRHGVQVVNLSRLERRSVEIVGGQRTLRLDLPRLLTDEIDMLVTMPVPKVHMNTQVSLTFKNQWGCIPENGDRLRLHPDFNNVVVAVNRAVKAGFAIVDGRFGLNRSGPLRGEEVRLGWVCVGNHIGAVARVVCELMGLRIESVPHLRHAARLGLVPSLDEITLNADLAGFRGPTFYLRREWTDLPGLLAFNSAALAYLAYFSPVSALLHRILYWFREPYYDYRKGS